MKRTKQGCEARRPDAVKSKERIATYRPPSGNHYRTPKNGPPRGDGWSSAYYGAARDGPAMTAPSNHDLGTRYSELKGLPYRNAQNARAHFIEFGLGR